ncbi:PLP-dependent transferase [Polychaeton citri CBS 116435]|uniref:PLP-dependent transferase n=1 Tax=Polychaeton citri CBS 116435 TaxID=1314669 RepID=A0A9P4Q6H6_9PEZI|nr:PLP-dependent transferase [Polychaeton citri CBS 116435]
MLSQTLSYIPPDAIFKLTELYNTDSDPRKVNLGQGTYKDEFGKPFILPAVKTAKSRLEGANHEYLPILGLPSLRLSASRLLFGDEHPAIVTGRVACSQSLSGTGALHLGGAFLRRVCDKSSIVYITDPSWSNHKAVFESVGFPVKSYRYLDDRGALDMENLVAVLKEAQPGSVFILHACAHNPSGRDPTQEQWLQIADIMQERSLFPVFDAAYLGMAGADFDSDAFAIRHFAERMEIGVCLSFAKIMGLYGERTGIVAFVSQHAGGSRVIESHLEQLQRAEISNPPAFGARVVAEVLGDETLQAQWRSDLGGISSRLGQMRRKLVNELNDSGCPKPFEHIRQQVGMFGILGLSLEQVFLLREKYHIYMADSSRVSIAGLNEGNVKYVAKAIAEVCSGI